MIPETTRDALLQAMADFDRHQRHTPEWQGWDQWRNFKYAIQHDDKLYPVKAIIALATHTPTSSFSGGPEANGYLKKYGLDVVRLRPDEPTDSPEDEANRQARLEHYATLFGSLRSEVDPSSWPAATLHRAPHKPLLLLSVLDLIAAGEVATNRIELNARLRDIFREYSRLVLGEDSSADARTPFRYLASEGFWHQSDSGTVPAAALDTDLYELLQHEAPRLHLRDVLIDTYFSPEAASRLRGGGVAREKPPAVWWVNQGGTYQQERDGHYLWAPQRARNGTSLAHHTNVARVAPGDIVLHYANGSLRAISRAVERAREAPRPSELPEHEWEHEGYLAPLTPYQELPEPIALSSIPLEWRAYQPGGPFTQGGAVNQGYLFPVAMDFLAKIASRFSGPWPALDGTPARNVWLFQANPKLFNLQEMLRTAHVGDADDWSVTRYAEEMQPGDIAVFWQGGGDAGIYALGELTGRPEERPYDLDNPPPWVKGTKHEGKPELAVPYRLTAILRAPVPRQALLSDSVLRNMQILRMPLGTNFRITAAEWQALQPYLEGRLDVDNGGPAIILPEVGEEEPPYVEPPFPVIVKSIHAVGLRLDEATIRQYHLGLKIRGFVILAGLSGSGKTWLAEAYAEAVDARLLVVPVAPNWNTNEDLLGFYSQLNSLYQDTPFSLFLREAAHEHARRGAGARPFHLVLDEMNLARVEYYFATFLSAMELRARDGAAPLHLGPESVLLTPNLKFVGTVNIDETTFTPADKVYDRAQLVEVTVPRESLIAHLGDVPYAQTLLTIWDHLHEVAPFAFRVMDEISAYIAHAEKLSVSWQEALDEQIRHKILPKMRGADDRAEAALSWLVTYSEPNFPLTHAKAKAMLEARRHYGVASYF